VKIPSNLALILALAIAASAANSADGPEVPEALATARSHFEDAAINPVSFRSTDAFFPVETVANGKAARVIRKRQALDPVVMLSGKAFAFDDALKATHTNALLVMREGVIVDERYLNGGSENSRFMSWSMAKSISSILVGIAIDKQLINSEDEPIERYVPQMKGTAYEGVTIEQLLTMRDGTSYTEQLPGAESTLDKIRKRSTYRNEKRFTDLDGLNLTRTSQPGTQFNYSTLTSTILGRLVEGASGMTLAKFTEKYLWKPAGMEASAYWLLDGALPQGQAVSGGGFNATLRDYGRLGQMMLDGGRINGKQIVSKAWVEKSTRDWSDKPVIPGAPRGYGYQWWTMKTAPGRYEAIGIHGQFMSIDPATRTVIVKLSHWPEKGGKQYNLDSLALLDATRSAVARPE